MKLNFKLLTLAMLSASAVAVYAAPYKVPGPAPVAAPLEPSSYTAITGNRLHPDWADTHLGFGPLVGGPAAPIFDVKTPHSNYIAQMDQDGTSSWEECITVGSAEVPILSIDVVPTDTGLLDIEFSTQAAINAGSALGSTLLVCSVTQGGGTANCSATRDNPALVQRIKVTSTQRLGNLGFSNYHGYVDGLQPNVPATVRIAGIALPAAATTLGQFCYSNLIVRNGRILPPT
jgi:hypothetical protein